MPKTRIILIWPRGFRTKNVIPLAIAYLKGNLNNKEFDIRVIDCALHDIDSGSLVLERMIREFDPRLVGVSCWSETYPEAMRILEKAKSISGNIMTAIGGVHATHNYKAIMQNKAVDFLFRGEAELNFSEFAAEMQKENPDLSRIKGLSYRTGTGQVMRNDLYWEKDLDKIKLPDYDGIDLEGYIKRGYRCHSRQARNAPVWVSRGCPYQCEFCLGPMHNGRMVRYHSIEYMIVWIKYLYYDKRIRSINIIDDNFTFDIKYAKELCRAIIKLNLKDLHCGNPNGVRMQHLDRELLGLMKQAGWEYLAIAPESGSLRTLKSMKKNLDPVIVPGIVKEIKSCGLKAVGFFIIGYPGEIEEDIKDTVRLVRNCSFDIFWLANFQPIPGTPAYERLVEKGEISRGFLPRQYSSGDLGYIPQGLQKFNFPLLRLREYLFLMVRNPSSLLYLANNFSHKEVAIRLLTNFISMFNLSKRYARN